MSIDLSKLKKKAAGRRSTLGAPPAPETAGHNLREPEHAPAAPTRKATAKKKAVRTKQFATIVTEAFHSKMKAVAARDGLKLNDLLEKALDAYERERGGK